LFIFFIYDQAEKCKKQFYDLKLWDHSILHGVLLRDVLQHLLTPLQSYIMRTGAFRSIAGGCGCHRSHLDLHFWEWLELRVLQTRFPICLVADLWSLDVHSYDPYHQCDGAVFHGTPNHVFFVKFMVYTFMHAYTVFILLFVPYCGFLIQGVAIKFQE
jgi:hypothetical protein